MPPAPVIHPLGPPTLSGNEITVDLMLQQPTRITRMIADLTLQRFVADRIFSSDGGVTGGAVVYDEVQANELYATRDVERVEPGDEFPILTTDRLAPKVAQVEKWGGKVYITDEARDRNDASQFTTQVRKVANTIVRKINQVAIDKLETAISAGSRTFVGRDWSAVVTAGSSASTAQNWPLRDFAHANALAEVDELGITYSLALLNSQEYERLVLIYGPNGLKSLLTELGWDVYVSNRVTAGTGYFVAEGEVGGMRIEKPLGTETWREQKTERTFVQSSVRPVMYVNNPFAVLKATGLAG